ncbi:MAG: ATP-binding protein [Candidatus Azobacteroides sp.]|nr:ATP-binding protein [Candidatus Azobacteroides sp.]
MKRNLFETLISHLEKKELSILVGARQTGKTTLLRQVENFCKGKNIPSVFMNLENKNLLSELNKSPLNILNFLPVTEKRVVVLIDEIQYLEDSSNFLKLLHDEHAKNIKIVATGSNAFYVDKTFKDSLVGRKRLFHLFTCSFDEYLKLRDREELYDELKRIRANPLAKTAKIETLQQEWNNYMLYGGYPAVVKEPDGEEKIAYLKEIRDSFVKRDILESGVQNEIAFYNLFRTLAAQTGKLINVNELSSSLKIKNETVNHYLYVLQKCFHIALIRPFFKNLRKELTKMPKAYFLDSGLRNCLINNFDPLAFRTDKNELWENMYFRLLVEKYDLYDISFWRTTEGNEVDFVLNRMKDTFAVGVKFEKKAIKESKYKMFRSAYPEIPLKFVWIEPFDENFFRL